MTAYYHRRDEKKSEMVIQAKSRDGLELHHFDTLQDVLVFANERNDLVYDLDEFTPPTNAQIDQMIISIVFHLPSGELVRLVQSGRDWVVNLILPKMVPLLGIEPKSSR